MFKAIQFLNEHLYRYMLPVCLFFVYRIIVCLLELGRTKTLREKKGIFPSVRSQYTEIGTFSLALIGGILTCAFGKFWMIFFPLTIVLGVIGFKLGRKKGTEMDDFYRELGTEMKKMATDELDGREEHPVLPDVTENEDITAEIADDE